MTRSRAIRKKRSIPESISASLGIEPTCSNDTIGQSTQDHFSINDNSYIGRSYVSGFISGPSSIQRTNNKNNKNSYLPISNNQFSRPIHEAAKLHKQTAAISETFEPSELDDRNIDDYIELVEHDESEIDPLDDSRLRATYSEASFESLEQQDEYSRLLLSPISSGYVPNRNHNDITQIQQEYESAGINSTSSKGKIIQFGYNLANYLPAAILGLLLNILDALSYGMIIFPITEPLFSQMGPTGLSMFYISTIISQLIYSGGWSSFGCGIGSEMIEVTPFFHTMALAVMQKLGEDRKDEIITTTIFCYVISSMLTGITFLLLGKMRLGKIVGFFPRHILIGCIGGVGYFLLVTGLEVCTRVAKFEYNIPFLMSLFTNTDILCKWLLPVILTIVLILTQRYFRNSLVLPSFYIITLILFHFVIAIVPSLSLSHLRETGWIFPEASTDSTWYDHYKLFNLRNVHWDLVIEQVPTMMALTFFGILHVPINVPALAMSLQVDKYDVDKELIAHGLSNFISGMLGSIQNYLVYTNSVLFIRAGADSSFAGYILVVLTIGVMLTGPVIISFIPICIVGSLIFLLGYELLVEALFDTWEKLTFFEYFTVVIIILTMGIFDFVLGVIIGILIACFKFLIDSSKLQTINGEFDGTVAKSTVYRDSIQTKFLNGIGEQIYVLKLQNLLFFGTIISIEEKVDKLLEISDNDSSKRRIKYLILDFKNINADNIDYSAAEGFNRIKRFTQTKRIQLIISSIRERDHIYNAFNNVGLLRDVELFNDLNSALEWCENEFLSQYKKLREKAKARLEAVQLAKSGLQHPDSQAITGDNNVSNYLSANQQRNLMSLPINTPRNYQILSVAQKVFKNEEQTVTTINDEFKSEDPVMPLLLVALKQYRPNMIYNDSALREEEFTLWSKLCPYFTKTILPAHSTLRHSNNIFFLVETGILKAVFHFPQGSVYETMSNKTCYGKIIRSGHSAVEGVQSLTIETETDSQLWIIDSLALEKLRKENSELYLELVLLIMTIKDRRFKDLIGHALVSA